MERLYKIPLLFFAIASCMGLLLRSQLVFPIKGITFSFLLHGHSHTMFLGWVFNVLFIAFVIQFTDGSRSIFHTIFWILQVLVLGMLVSFPLQGYGLYSIVFSALHTMMVFVFIVLFFLRTQKRTEISVWLARVSLIFFAISSLGPFFLAYLKANDLEHLNIYRNSIYFYLHFQYNGCFYFGILSLFVNLIEGSAEPIQLKNIKISCWLFAAAAFPAYALSVLWSNPGMIFNIVGGIAALVQLVALLLFLTNVNNVLKTKVNHLAPQFTFTLRIAALALILKIVLQLISAPQEIANMINDHRSIVVAYLHLMLVGIVTFFLIGWLIQNKVIAQGFSKWGNWLMLTGFIGSESILFALPWHENIFTLDPIKIQVIIMIFSCTLVIGVVFHFLGSLSLKKGNSQ